MNGVAPNPEHFPPEGRRIAFSVSLLGTACDRTLRARSPGTVLAVFRRSFYVEMESGSLVCIGAPGLGAGPLNGICALPEGFDWEAAGLLPGAAVRWAGQELRVGDRFVFTLRDAVVWGPPAPPRATSREDLVNRLSRGLARLAAECPGRTPAEGFAPLVLPLTGLQGGAFPGRESANPLLTGPLLSGPLLTGPALNNALLKVAREGIAGIVGWLKASLSGDRAALTTVPSVLTTVPPALESLIGLGPGLTPSGDDFLGGVMIALHAMDHGTAAERLAGWVLPLARERTSPISLAHLACAAQGEGSGALHEILLRIMGGEGEPEQSLALASWGECLDAVDAIGHTSGWDALAGIAATLATVCATRVRSPHDSQN